MLSSVCGSAAGDQLPESIARCDVDILGDASSPGAAQLPEVCRLAEQIISVLA